MTFPLPSQTDLTNQFLMLLPNGIAWNKEQGSNMWEAIYALMGIYTDLYSNTAALLVDTFPSTTEYNIENWFLTLGLPNKCSLANPTVAEAQQQITARFAGLLGSSVPFLIQYTQNLGYTITITEYGEGNTLSDTAFTPVTISANYIQFNLPDPSPTYFQSGRSNSGDFLGVAAIDYSTLECELQQIIPQTSIAYFNIAN